MVVKEQENTCEPFAEFNLTPTEMNE